MSMYRQLKKVMVRKDAGFGFTIAAHAGLTTPPMVSPTSPSINASPFAEDNAIGSLGNVSPHIAPAGCPQTSEWNLHLSATRQKIEDAFDDMLDRGLRPISVTATGSTETPRFDVVWMRDEKGIAGEWFLLFDRDKNTLLEEIAQHRQCRVVAVDAYGFDLEDLRYVSAWVCDGRPSRSTFGVSEAELVKRNTELTDLDLGFSPIWVDAHFRPGSLDGDFTRFSAIWVADGRIRILDTDLDRDTGDDPRWESRTNRGLRLISLSQYMIPKEGQTDLELLDPSFKPRYAAVWETVPVTCQNMWEAHRRQTESDVYIRAAAQSLGARVAPRDFSLVAVGDEIQVPLNDTNELKLLSEHTPGSVRLELPEDVTESPATPFALHRILVKNEGPSNGDLLFLRTKSGHPIVVESATEQNQGNIRLRRWNWGSGPPDIAVDEDCLLFSCAAQDFHFDNWVARLVLRFDAASGEWQEVQRNGFSPGLFMPISIDNSSGRLTSIWLQRTPVDTQPFYRVFMTTDAAEDNFVAASSIADQQAHQDLQSLDQAMESFMRARGIPNGVLAISRDGRLVYHRAFTFATLDERAVNAYAPNVRFKIASVTKPVTTIAVMRLVEEGRLNLDTPLSNIPGLSDLIGEGWDPRVMTITSRQLLAHMGGWDRDISPDSDFTVGNDFKVCDNDAGGLPVDLSRLFAFAAGTELDHSPGTRQVYSNFGYTMLGRVIEAITGTPYHAYLRNEILLPIGVQDTFLHPAGPGADLTGSSWYYEPNYPVTPSVFGIPSSGVHPLREECNSDHADLLPAGFGRYNVPLMDAHGGLVSTAPDLVRILNALDDTSFMAANIRSEMWSLPVGRETRVFTVDAGGQPTDVSFNARLAGTVNTVTILPRNTEQLVIGKGFDPFSQILFAIAVTPTTSVGEPAPYELELEYWNGNNWAALSASEHELSFEHDNMFVDLDTNNQTRITFEPPEDWTPVIIPQFDPSPRCYVRLTSPTEAAAPAEADWISVGSDISYALGWTVSYGEGARIGLPVENFIGAPNNRRIVGARSQASARLVADFPANSILLVLDNFTGGSFLPGERLLSGDITGFELGRVGETREQPLSISAAHSGKLNGVSTYVKRRPDGIAWAVMVNQANNSESFYVRSNAPSDASIEAAIDAVATWPSWDLHDQE